MARKNQHKVNLFNTNYFHTHYFQCTVPECGYEFREADWTYFGIDVSSKWHHVCENHRYDIHWASLQIYGHLTKEEHRVEPYTIPTYMDPPQPNTDLWLWRYLDLTKFKNFIETKSIFFPRAVLFNDPLECAVSIKSREHWLASVRATAYRYDHEIDGLSEKEKYHVISQKIQAEIERNKNFRNEVLISCWHANDFESEAMWQLYKGDNHQTVAISIKMVNLRNALPKPIHIGEISYVTYEKIYPTKIRAFKKHISYEHEKEIRAVIFPENITHKVIKDITVEQKEIGLLIKPVEKFLQILVYISPWSDRCFRNEVKHIVAKSDWNRGNRPNPSILKIIETKYDPIY